MTVPDGSSVDDVNVLEPAAATATLPLEPPLAAVISTDTMRRERIPLDVLEPIASGRRYQEELNISEVEASVTSDMSLLTRVMIGTATMLCYFVSVGVKRMTLGGADHSLHRSQPSSWSSLPSPETFTYPTWKLSG